jgi:hypothetical protein
MQAICKKPYPYLQNTKITSALAVGKWLGSRPCRFNAVEIAPGTHWLLGWVGLRVSMDALEKRKISCKI